MREIVPSLSGPAGLKAFAALSTVVLTRLFPEVSPLPLQIPVPLSVQTAPLPMALVVELPLAADVLTMA